MYEQTDIQVVTVPGRLPGEDDELCAAAARDDPRQFVVLYERYVGRVYRYCLVRLGTSPAAQDATSEVFLKALDKLASYRRGPFAAWLFAIARNTVNDHYRQRRTISLDVALDVADTSSGADAHLISNERLAAIRGLSRQLSKEQRDLVELQLAGWNDMEIAKALGKSRDAVKMLRYRALKKLRDCLAKDGWDIRDWLLD